MRGGTLVVSLPFPTLIPVGGGVGRGAVVAVKNSLAAREAELVAGTPCLGGEIPSLHAGGADFGGVLLRRR